VIVPQTESALEVAAKKNGRGMPMLRSASGKRTNSIAADPKRR
jgi:hypothetical protein